ncbi:MAG: YdcF family protein [Bacteroidales bacterium]|jgi:uncharacterized SAM-binding protein YcdF (DUF218 family)|nr:YdcF family protein [Bacteroidales bacterium]
MTAFRRSTLFIVFLFILIIAYVGGCRRAGAWLTKEDVPVHADAIILLMGNFPERVLQVHDTWESGLADRVIIVEESMGPFSALESRGASIVSNSEQAAGSLVALGIPVDSIVLLPGNALSTLDEAYAVGKCLAGNSEADTLILVSSPAHMRRAYMIFNSTLRAMDKNVVIGCKPSSYSSFNGVKWWRRKEDIQTVFAEYIKIASYMLVEKHKLPGSEE